MAGRSPGTPPEQARMNLGFELPRRGRVRNWLSGDAPSSRGAQLFLCVSALLCGAVLSGLLFVGVWRHTATEVTRTQAARLSDRQALLASKRTVASLRMRLAHDQEQLANAARRSAQAAAELAGARNALGHAAQVQAANSAARHLQTLRLVALIGVANTLVHSTSALQSELTALDMYALHPGTAGLDGGYLATQAHYLEASAANAASAASDLAQRARELDSPANPAGASG